MRKNNKSSAGKLSLENKNDSESENGDVADILEETIEELNGIILTLKKISNWKRLSYFYINNIKFRQLCYKWFLYFVKYEFWYLNTIFLLLSLCMRHWPTSIISSVIYNYQRSYHEQNDPE